MIVLIGASIFGVVTAQGLQTQALPLPRNSSQGCQSLNGTSGSQNFALYPGDPRDYACFTFQFNGIAAFNWTGNGKPISFSLSFGPVIRTGWTGACPLDILWLYAGDGVSGSGSVSEMAQPHPITCQGYAMAWSDSSTGGGWTNASFVSVSLTWVPR